MLLQLFKYTCNGRTIHFTILSFVSLNFQFLIEFEIVAKYFFISQFANQVYDIAELEKKEKRKNKQKKILKLEIQLRGKTFFLEPKLRK